MTSHNRSDTDPSKFKSKTPHFFKVILDETIRDGKLGIPRKFVRKHGDRLPNTLQLEVPSGAIWKVELTKFDEEVWLQKGWQEFAEHYSLKHGHFLVFRYQGNARFHVLIFDKSATEIEYPYTNTEEEEEEDDDDDVSVSRKSKEKSHFPCPRPHQKIRTDFKLETLSSRFGADDPKSGTPKLGNLNNSRRNLHADGSSSVKIRRSVGDTEPNCRQTRFPSSSRECKDTKFEEHEIIQVSDDSPSPVNQKRKKKFPSPSRSIQAKGMKHEKQKNMDKELRDDFKCSAKYDRRRSFTVLMQPSYVDYRFDLNIPNQFAKRHFKKKGELTLRVSDGRSWIVNCYVSSRHAKAWIPCNSWRAFAVDNKLKVGDICVFELVKENGTLLEVVIFPAAGCSSSKLGCTT